MNCGKFKKRLEDGTHLYAFICIVELGGRFIIDQHITSDKDTSINIPVQTETVNNKDMAIAKYRGKVLQLIEQDFKNIE